MSKTGLALAYIAIFIFGLGSLLNAVSFPDRRVVWPFGEYSMYAKVARYPSRFLQPTLCGLFQNGQTLVEEEIGVSKWTEPFRWDLLRRSIFHLLDLGGEGGRLRLRSGLEKLLIQNMETLGSKNAAGFQLVGFRLYMVIWISEGERGSLRMRPTNRKLIIEKMFP